MEECHKISEVYERVSLHAIWLERLGDVLYSVEGLLGIVLSMIQVYSCRESKNMSSIVNKLS